VLHLLVLRCQAGDEKAFTRLYEMFGDKTLGYLRGLVGDDALDVQQDVWLSVFKNIRGIVNPSAFRTWLFRTTRHRAMDYLRGARRERELIDDVGIEVVDFSDEASGGWFEGIDESDMDVALTSMPPPQREVLLLRYRDELSYKEIALVVGCPMGTVRTRLYHAKRRMQELLKRGES
jgi:RNA polymerase sigma-70 factor (ECF subfamily)